MREEDVEGLPRPLAVLGTLELSAEGLLGDLVRVNGDGVGVGVGVGGWGWGLGLGLGLGAGSPRRPCAPVEYMHMHMRIHGYMHMPVTCLVTHVVDMALCPSILVLMIVVGQRVISTTYVTRHVSGMEQACISMYQACIRICMCMCMCMCQHGFTY